jgi:LemA protein
VKRRNRVAEALSGIDVQLRQRHDLIPNVLAIARRFMEHERGLLEGITALRNGVQGQAGERDLARIGERFQAEAQLGTQMGRLFAVAESYPELKSDGPMTAAQRAYEEVETNISAATRFYNAAVGDLRDAIQIFPGSLLAGLAGVKTAPPFFEADEATRANVAADDHL